MHGEERSGEAPRGEERRTENRREARANTTIIEAMRRKEKRKVIEKRKSELKITEKSR